MKVRRMRMDTTIPSGRGLNKERYGWESKKLERTRGARRLEGSPSMQKNNQHYVFFYQDYKYTCQYVPVEHDEASQPPSFSAYHSAPDSKKDCLKDGISTP